MADNNGHVAGVPDQESSWGGFGAAFGGFWGGFQGAAAGGAVATFAGPEATPAGAFVGGLAGRALGSMVGEALGRQFGRGLDKMEDMIAAMAGKGSGADKGVGPSSPDMSETAATPPDDDENRNDKRQNRNEDRQHYATEKEARTAAKKNGWKETNYVTNRGTKVYLDPKTKNYYTRDTSGRTFPTTHNGGAWKGARTPQDLLNKRPRLGTYDRAVNLIGE